MAFKEVHFRAVVIALFVAIAGICVREVSSVDLTLSGINTVTDETRYTHLNPDAKLVLFNKELYAKGNIIFTSGQRIDGDRLILTNMEENQYTRNEDVEVLIRYPAQGTNGYILSFVQIYADLSSTTADTYFVDGGIGKTYAEILMVANQTSNFGYQIYLYGY